MAPGHSCRGVRAPLWYSGCILAAVLAAATGPAWALDGEALARHDRWHPGEGLRDGDWYTYVICGAGFVDGACHLSRLEFAVLDHSWRVDVAAAGLVGHGNDLDLAESDVGPRGGKFGMIVDPDTLNVRYDGAAGAPYAHSIQSTLFFLGGTIRPGDAYGNDPILEPGRVWARLHESRSSQPWHDRGFDARGSVVVTGTGDGHGFCGLNVNATTYRVTYIDEAAAYADIVDGLPFPVHGAAYSRNPDLVQIHGDRLLAGPHWYSLVEYSGMRADPRAGGICGLAAAVGAYGDGGARRDGTGDSAAAAWQGRAHPPPERAGPADTVSVFAGASGGAVVVRGEVFNGTTAPYVVLGVYDESRSFVHRAYAVPDGSGSYRVNMDAAEWGDGTYMVTATYHNATAVSSVRVWGTDATAPFEPVRVLGSGMSVGCAAAGGDVLFAHMREGALVLSLWAKDDGLLLLEIPPEVASYLGGPPYLAYVDGRPAADYAVRAGDHPDALSAVFPAGARQVWVYGA